MYHTHTPYEGGDSLSEVLQSGNMLSNQPVNR